MHGTCLPLAGDLALPISEMGECEREGESRGAGSIPSSVSCFTTLVLDITVFVLFRRNRRN